jgi:hypothetical protein
MRDVEWEDTSCCKLETDDVTFTCSDDGWNELKWTTCSGWSAGNSRQGNNGDGNGRNSVDWEVEQIKGTDGEEMMLVMVELGMGVTAEDI